MTGGKRSETISKPHQLQIMPWSNIKVKQTQKIYIPVLGEKHINEGTFRILATM